MNGRRFRALTNKPQYVYRPSQLARRVRFAPGRYGRDATVTANLPSGLPIEVWPSDAIGSSIMRTGIYDLLVSEVLLRLSATGDLAVDAGANIGQMSAVLALGCGPSGRVLSFEPHPLIIPLLDRNIRRWAQDPRAAPIALFEAGLSDRRATARLQVAADFASNRGTSRVSTSTRDDDGAYEIDVMRLDDLDIPRIDLLKLDVEGHEQAVLGGAQRLLGAGAIRDVVFEEHERYPTPVTELLESAGFDVLGVTQRLRGPSVVRPADAAHVLWDPPALIASREPDRVRRALRSRGWRVLRAAR